MNLNDAVLIALLTGGGALGGQILNLVYQILAKRWDLAHGRIKEEKTFDLEQREAERKFREEIIAALKHCQEREESAQESEAKLRLEFFTTVATLRREIDEWRGKYFDLERKYNSLTDRLQLLENVNTKIVQAKEEITK